MRKFNSPETFNNISWFFNEHGNSWPMLCLCLSQATWTHETSLLLYMSLLLQSLSLEPMDQHSGSWWRLLTTKVSTTGITYLSASITILRRKYLVTSIGIWLVLIHAHEIELFWFIYDLRTLLNRKSSTFSQVIIFPAKWSISMTHSSFQIIYCTKSQLYHSHSSCLGHQR